MAFRADLNQEHDILCCGGLLDSVNIGQKLYDNQLSTYYDELPTVHDESQYQKKCTKDPDITNNLIKEPLNKP